jgi:hypothetical protein
MKNDAPITVIETPAFLGDAKRHLSDKERWSLVTALAMDPEIGDVMAGTGGARKLRWARPFSGKSGGFRVIYYYHSSAVPLLILGLFAKNEKINLSKAEMNELEKILSNYAKHYLTGVRKHVKGR